MANSLSGFLSVYAQESLPQLIAGCPLLNSFSTDFSADAANGGSSIVTRIPSTSYSLNDTDANGITAVAASSSAVTITLKQRDITHAFSDLEWSSYPNILQTFVPSMVKALVDGVTADVLSLVTNANYSTAGFTGAATLFSGSNAVKLAQVLSTAKVPAEDRTLVVLPTYFETLVNSISPAYLLGNAEAVQNYRIMAYAGFNPVVEYASIPNNSENLVGFAAHKSAIAVATRIPAVPPASVESFNMTDAKSGLTIQFRQAYTDAGRWNLTATLIYGAAKGNAGALKRIVSA